jgi:hypothetical protein
VVLWLDKVCAFVWGFRLCLRKQARKAVMANQAKVDEIFTEQIAKRIYRRRVTNANMYWGIFLCALANWNKLEPVYRADLRYATAEDLRVVDLWERKIAAQIKRGQQ